MTSQTSRREASRPVGIREQEVDERPEGDAADDPAEREDPVVVRLGQGGEEPEVPDVGEQDAGAVLGAAPEGDQTADHEREPDRQGERERRRLVVVVVARQDEPGRARGKEDREAREQAETADGHASSVVSVPPHSSPLGMKPRAPLCWIKPP